MLGMAMLIDLVGLEMDRYMLREVLRWIGDMIDDNAITSKALE